MPFFSSLQRLTWVGNTPAPFESSVSVFQKVMALNGLTFGELQDLICRKTALEYDLDLPSRLLSDSWVDFERYSALLRVDQARLKEGFLHWLGFGAIPGKPSGVRHCPECARLLYHSSLFDLAFVKKCPLHNCMIERPCYGCIARFQVGLGNRNSWELVSDCHCGYKLGSLFKNPGKRHLPPELAERMLSHGRQLVGWWATVKQKQKGAKYLLCSLMKTGEFDNAWDAGRLMSQDFVDQIAPFPHAWGREAMRIPARAVSYRHVKKVKSTDENLHRHEFASVRRYLWKRFVKRHVGCLKMLLRMPDEERQCLDAAYFCSVCVAFLTWLGPTALQRTHVGSSLSERSPTHDRFKFAHANQFSSEPRKAELALFSFMRGWAEIERLIEHVNIEIYNGEERYLSTNVPYVVIDDDYPHGLDVGESSVIILRADERPLEARANARCSSRLRKYFLLKSPERSVQTL